MNSLTDRQKHLLILIIRDYIESAKPVGSQRLVEDYRLGLSPATIRNEMSALTEMGYLRQQHTAAGRVPTEEGYRYFVSQMMYSAELPEAIHKTIAHQFHQSRADMNQWMTLAGDGGPVVPQSGRAATPTFGRRRSRANWRGASGSRNRRARDGAAPATSGKTSGKTVDNLPGEA